MQPANDFLGTLLGGRYRLVAVLGSGSSANVFLGEDTTLERLVAVKLLQPVLAQDAAFLKRFRAEARAVAALNHPNILRVFDWGEEDGVPYLVMEHLAGGSLKDLLDAGVRLSQEQAASMGEQAAAGLAYAHARGLVHRDVKPANLLFDEEGRLRITDFGVARALAEATWTEPEGAMIGTVRYASPEQAEGSAVDGKADVYSLSLVIYESLSGTVPFIADTPIATLRARVGQPLPHHSSLGSLDAVLAQGAAPEVAARLDAVSFEARLASVAAALPPPGPLPLAIHRASDVLAPVDPVAAEQFRPPSADELTQVTAAVTTGPVPTGVSKPFDVDELDDQTVIGGPIDGSHRRKRRIWPWIVAAVIVLGAIFGVVAIQTKLFVPSVTVPALTGEKMTSARAQLEKEQLTVVFAPAVYSITVPKYHIIRQDPRAGSVLKQGSTVTLVASRGLPPVSIPSLSGLDCAHAQATLAAVHLKGDCPPTSATYSATVPVNQVVSFSQNGVSNPSTVPYGTTVEIVISKGPPPVPVPQVSGSFAQAEAALVAAGFKVAEAKEYSSSVAAGTVTRTDPATGTPIQKGTTVTVYVSLGPPNVAIPSMVGKTVAAASSILTNLGLKVGAVYGPPGGHVFHTTPAAGTTVKIGSSVNLYVR